MKFKLVESLNSIEIMDKAIQEHFGQDKPGDSCIFIAPNGKFINIYPELDAHEDLAYWLQKQGFEEVIGEAEWFVEAFSYVRCRNSLSQCYIELPIKTITKYQLYSLEEWLETKVNTPTIDIEAPNGEWKNYNLNEYFPEDIIKLIKRYYASGRLYENHTQKENDLVFLSDKNMNGKTLTPRVPNNFLIKNGYEDGEIPRVCFARSIDGALMGLSQNLIGKEFYVHQPKNINKKAIYKPNIKEVPDVKITGEVWYTEPVELECIGKILVTADDGKDGHKYTYGNNTAELYGWNWRWENKLKESLSTKIKRRDNENDFSPFGYQVDFYDNDNHIGTASVCGIKDNNAFLYDLEVFPEYRGKGYGNDITKFMIDKYDIKQLYVRKDNTKAINLYKKFGFEITDDANDQEYLMER